MPADATTPVTTNGEQANNDDDLSQASEDPAQVKPWDEGGPSDCGYSETIHATLMSVGRGVHGLVGTPTSGPFVHVQTAIGNWFQELSYATRDIVRGENDVHEDAAEAVRELMGGDSSHAPLSPETPATLNTTGAQL